MVLKLIGNVRLEKGQKLLAQGNALGFVLSGKCALKGQKL